MQEAVDLGCVSYTKPPINAFHQKQFNARWATQAGRSVEALMVTCEKLVPAHSRSGVTNSETVTMRADLLGKAAMQEALSIDRIQRACVSSVSYKNPMYFSQEAN